MGPFEVSTWCLHISAIPRRIHVFFTLSAYPGTRICGCALRTGVLLLANNFDEAEAGSVNGAA